MTAAGARRDARARSARTSRACASSTRRARTPSSSRSIRKPAVCAWCEFQEICPAVKRVPMHASARPPAASETSRVKLRDFVTDEKIRPNLKGREHLPIWDTELSEDDVAKLNDEAYLDEARRGASRVPGLPARALREREVRAEVAREATSTSPRPTSGPTGRCSAHAGPGCIRRRGRRSRLSRSVRVRRARPGWRMMWPSTV